MDEDGIVISLNKVSCRTSFTFDRICSLFLSIFMAPLDFDYFVSILIGISPKISAASFAFFKPWNGETKTLSSSFNNVSRSSKLVVELDGIAGFGFFIKQDNLEKQRTQTFCPGKIDNVTF